MPIAVCPRSTKRESVKVTRPAAKIWTAAGICDQCGRTASNAGQPLRQEFSPSAGRLQLPEV
ncbi:hypothetical protein [Lentzea albida]|nr:hypothetical protein [Lentzea albida]